jgi:hypothetical protein
MDLADEFRRHSAECRQMARATRDLESKGSWNLLADRWARCAELEEGRKATARRPDKIRREPRPIYQHAS